MIKNNFSIQVQESISKIDLKKIHEVSKFLKKKKSQIFLAGNGASASIANHVATDLTKSAGFNAKTLNESNLITCLSNDYGYENWMSKGLEFYSSPSDIVILISSSGKSNNIINAAKFCKKNKMMLITLSGFLPNNPLQKYGKYNFYVKSNNYNVIEATHLVILLNIVENLIS
jgi:D-sedoheptulose 7-phosphate isomerase